MISKMLKNKLLKSEIKIYYNNDESYRNITFVNYKTPCKGKIFKEVSIWNRM